MKKTLYAAVLLLSLSMMATSCVTTYDVNHQKSLYESQMTSHKKSKALMEKVPVYFSEAEIGRKFTVMYYCNFEPLTIPILHSEKKVLNKKFYRKAVETAERLNGDAVIIDTKNSFRVIKMK